MRKIDDGRWRNVIERLLAMFVLIVFFPLLIILYIIVRFSSRGPFIFKQRRAGKDKKPFTVYKIRTMVENAERLKPKLLQLNEADGPVFKIHNDPRFTKVGKFLAYMALDEIPQLFNIVKGDMTFVGPRPLPVDEARKVPKIYEARFWVLPGMTSSWVVGGCDHSSFKRWMKLDIEYVKKKGFWYDVRIFIATIRLVTKLIIDTKDSKSTSGKLRDEYTH